MIDADAFMVGFGREVRALRARRGWTQGELASRVPGLTANGVSELENGRGNPGVRRVLDLAAALGVPSADLVADAIRNARCTAEAS